MATRDRHGRGIRRPILPYDLPGYQTRRDTFERLVREAAERLDDRWGTHWGKLEFGIEDVPPSDPSPWEPGVTLSRLFPADLGFPARIVLYRRPILMRADDEILVQIIRELLAEQVGHLLGRSSEEIDPDYGRDER